MLSTTNRISLIRSIRIRVSQSSHLGRTRAVSDPIVAESTAPSAWCVAIHPTSPDPASGIRDTFEERESPFKPCKLRRASLVQSFAFSGGTDSQILSAHQRLRCHRPRSRFFWNRSDLQPPDIVWRVWRQHYESGHPWPDLRWCCCVWGRP